MYKKDQEEEISLDQNGEFHSSGINETVSFAIHLQLFFFNQNGEFCSLNKNSCLFFEVPALVFEIEQEQSVIYIYIYILPQFHLCPSKGLELNMSLKIGPYT